MHRVREYQGRLPEMAVLLAAAVLLWAALPAAADTVRLAPGHPDSYIVRKGDTLWDISGKFLVKPWRWPELWQINPQIENPHLIYPGDTVRLVYRAGAPRLTVERGNGAQAVPDEAGAEVESAAESAAEPAAESAAEVGRPRPPATVAVEQARRVPAGGRNVKLEPRVREYRREGISALSLDHMQPFLEFPLLVEPRDFELRPYVLEMGMRTTVRTGSLRDRVYVRGVLEPGVSTYAVFSLAAEHEDPDDPQRISAYEAHYVGEVRIVEYSDPAIAVITRSVKEFSHGDRLYPSREVNRQEAAELDIVPHVPPSDVDGRILSIVGGNLQVARYQVLLLDIGEDDGVGPGTVLSISTRDRTVEDSLYARQAALRGEKAGRISFRYEDESPVDDILSRFVNDMVSIYRRFQELRLQKVGGVPISGLPQKVRIPGSPRGELMVFRSFSRHSYALVMTLLGPAFVSDRVHSPR